MDYSAILKMLYAERERVLTTIAALEEILPAAADPTPSARRGRKFMGSEERAVVSARMRAHWAKRRKEQRTE